LPSTRRRGARTRVRTGRRLAEVLLLGMRERPVEQVPGHGRGGKRPPRTLRPGPRDPAAVALVRRLRVRAGADPRRRPRALPGGQAALEAALGDRDVEVPLSRVGGPPEVEPLGLVAAESPHDRVLLRGLDTFGNEIELERVAEVDDALEEN